MATFSDGLTWSQPGRSGFNGTCSPKIVRPPGVAMFPARRFWTYLRSA